VAAVATPAAEARPRKKERRLEFITISELRNHHDVACATSDTEGVSAQVCRYQVVIRFGGLSIDW